jgi:signal transduction histidine kinase
MLARGVARARRTAEQMSERLLQMDQMKNEFLANVSHELRTPLNAIINIPEALLADFAERPVLACGACGASFEDDVELDVANTACTSCGATSLARMTRMFPPDDGAMLAGRLQSVARSGRHLLAVVNDVLDHSRLVAQRFSITRSRVAVDELVARAVEHVGPVAAPAGVKLRSTVPGGLELDVDPLRVVQVLVNLLANAVKFSPRGATVEVQARRDGDVVVLEVSDRGAGIAAEHHALIFEAYRQVDGGHTRKHGGTGLGLSIVKQIVELHGGTVEVRSSPGAGATFSVRLPAPPSTVTNSAAPAERVP